MRQDKPDTLDRWIKWAAAVEAKLGHSLDGNQDTDGYSMDAAIDLYDAECSVTGAVAAFEATKLNVLIAQAAGCGLTGPYGYRCTHHESGEHVARGTEPGSFGEAWPIVGAS